MKTYLNTLSAVLFMIVAACAEPVMIADFEDNKPGLVKGTALKAEIATEAEHVKEGGNANKLVLDYGSLTAGSISWKVEAGSDISQETGRLSLWIFGDGSEAKLQFNFEADDKGKFLVEKTIDWQGWQEFSIPLAEFKFTPNLTNFPDALPDWGTERMKRFFITIYHGINKQPGVSTLYVDAIQLIP